MPGAPPKPAGYAFPGLMAQGRENCSPFFSSHRHAKYDGGNSPNFAIAIGFPEFSTLPRFSPLSSIAGGSSSWYANNYVLGNLSLLEALGALNLGRQLLPVADFFQRTLQQGDGFYQQLGLAETYHTERWLFQLVDQFPIYLQSSFGFGGGTNLGVPGVGGTPGPSFPGWAAITFRTRASNGVGPRYSNTAVFRRLIRSRGGLHYGFGLIWVCKVLRRLEISINVT